MTTDPTAEEHFDRLTDEEQELRDLVAAFRDIERIVGLVLDNPTQVNVRTATWCLAQIQRAGATALEAAARLDRRALPSRSADPSDGD